MPSPDTSTARARETPEAKGVEKKPTALEKFHAARRTARDRGATVGLYQNDMPGLRSKITEAVGKISRSLDPEKENKKD